MLFRTYESSHDISLKCKIWEAARATSAVPILFDHIKIGTQPFIFAGMGYNNPSLMVLEEAKALFGARQIGCFVSIGSGRAREIHKSGFWQWPLPITVIQTLTLLDIDCENSHKQLQSLFEDKYPPNSYFRLNVDREGMEGVALSERETMDDVEGPTTEYMRRNEVDEQLASLTKAMSPLIEQLQ